MPPPGQTRPARFHVYMRDLVWDVAVCAGRERRGLCRRPAQQGAVLDHSRVPDPRVRSGRGAVDGAGGMALILDALVQLAQLLLVLALAPLLTGYVRKVKAHLLRRRGPPVLQPYRDLLKLIRKEVVLADNASWVFRVAPYLDLRHHPGRRGAGAHIRHRSRVQPGGRPHRDRGAPGQRPLRSGAGGPRYRHEFRRHRLEPRDDDRLARRAGDADDRVHAVAAGRLDAAFVGVGVHAGTRRRAARVAGHVAGGADHGGDRGERADSRRQSRDPSRADDDPRGHDPRVLGTASRGASRRPPRSSCCSISP